MKSRVKKNKEYKDKTHDVKRRDNEESFRVGLEDFVND